MVGMKEETWNEEGVPGTWVLGHLGWEPEKEHGSFSLGFLLRGGGAVRGLKYKDSQTWDRGQKNPKHMQSRHWRGSG